MATTTHHVLAISGSLRTGSTSTAVLRTATRVAPRGVTVTLFERLGTLPPFNPDDDVAPLPPAVQTLRAACGAADSLLLSTPEYAGALPGSFKNLLDWTVGGVELSRMPVAWINVSVSPTGAVAAHEELRRVLGFVEADIVDAACIDLAVPRAAVGADGQVEDDALRKRIGEVLRTLAAHARATVT
jgi:chromate reductase, NAD(P)H dehydrogenase (quinone)